jgi:phosphohistidine phosphatase
MPEKQLVLLRHAKSSWSDADLSDHDRPLNGRGRGDATRIGHYLRDTQWSFDLVLCSSARRTCQTLQRLGLADDTAEVIEDRLYGAEAGDLLARLRTVAASVRSVLLIGHNPGIEQLAALLVDGAGATAESFPTGALAELQLPITAWGKLEPGVGRVRTFVVPRDLP